MLVRHLIMPGMVDDAKAVLDFLATLDIALPIRIISNYEPMHDAAEHPVIGRRVLEEETDAVVSYAKKELKLKRVLVG